MSDFFRSAINYLSQAGVSVGQCIVGGRTDHPLVGSTVKMANYSLKIRSLIAEGGYALVFAAQDHQNNWFALKRQLAADRSSAEAIIQEIQIMKELSGHPFIVSCLHATRLEPRDGRTEFLLLMELCSGGTLIDYLQKNMLNVGEICKIFYSACSAVQHLHDRNPPITHRDIKIENLLFDSKGFIKLCDFGSATTEIFRPNDDWNVSKRTFLEEDMAKFTTPMYRAPEILDTYHNYPIGPAQDIWALGCILYYLCYRQHPFEDSAKLRIINAKFMLPDADRTNYSIFHSIICNTLQPNPYSRPTIYDLCEYILEIAKNLKIILSEPVFSNVVQSSLNGFSTFADDLNKEKFVGQHDENCSNKNELSNNASEIFAQLKGQGILLFKNIKDKSNAIMQNAQLGSALGLNPIQYSTSEVEHTLTPLTIPKPLNFSVASTSCNDHHSSHASDIQQQQNNNIIPRSLPLQHSNVKTSNGHGNFWDQLSKNKLNSFLKPPEVFHQINKQERNVDSKDEKLITPSFDYDILGIGKETKISSATFSLSNPAPNKFDPFAIFSGIVDNSNWEEKNPFVSRFQDDDISTMSKAHSNIADLLDFSANSTSNDIAPVFNTNAETLSFQAKQDSMKNQLSCNNLFNANILTTHLNNGLKPKINQPTSNISKNFDPFCEFLRSSFEKSVQVDEKPKSDIKPNYSRTLFEDQQNVFASKLPPENVFDDLLSLQGFSASSKQANHSLADLQRKIDVKDMDSIDIKIHDWTKGKERNIRALLGSLSDVLWEDVEGRWVQPSMSELLSYTGIKKNYRKACLVVHPDKQTGSVNESLAKAIFTELNDAWNTFEENSSV